MKKLFFKSTENIVSITIRFLQLLHVKVTDSTVAETLLLHPNYPSLLSVSNALQSWHIETLVVQVTEEQLQDLPLPVLTHIQNDEASFVIITEVDDKFVVYVDDKDSRVKINRNTFLEVWNRNVLLVEINEKSGEENYKSKAILDLWNRLRIPLLLLLWLLVGLGNTLAFLFNNISSVFDKIYFACIYITNVTGILISGLLLLYDYNDSNSVLKKICSAGGMQSDCKAVLNSKASRLFGAVSWADVGLVYFLGNYFYLLLVPYHSSFFLPVILLSTLALPYILFSVFYQSAVVKQWCVLCLTVQAILLLQFLSGLFTGHFHIAVLREWNVLPWLNLWMAYFIPSASWTIIKPYLYQSRDASDIKKELIRLKSNADVFHYLLLQNIPVQNSPDGIGLLIGNDISSPASIILISNPYCGACGDAHSELEQLLRIRTDRNAEIIFFVSNDETDTAYQVVAHFFVISQLSDKHMLYQALTDWYKNKEYDSFVKRYPVSNIDLAKQKARMLAMNEWCRTENITFTPCVYVNGFRLPKEYSIPDLTYL